MKNLNSEIEFLPFLSTSPIEANVNDLAGNDLLTIYIPSFFGMPESKNIEIRGGYVNTLNFDVTYT